MILFLDPDPLRAALAFQRMNKEDQSNTIWAKTYEEAQTTLWNYRDELTEVHMEHDLSGTPYMNTRSEESGMELVRYLEKLSVHHDDVFGAYQLIKWVVHTYNDHAGPIMVERLRKIGLKVDWIPFGT
jgi:hypothetical protein